MVKISLDTKNFDKAYNEYIKFNKRAPADIINAKLYFIARNATNTTKHSDKSKIEAELRGPSEKYEGVPLGALIVNKQLRAKGEKGLSGVEMGRALTSLIKRRKASVNYIRSGWKNAVKILENYLKLSGEFTYARRWAKNKPADRQTMNKKVSNSSGTAIFAKANAPVPRVWGEIQNNLGGDGKAQLGIIKEDGLQAAIDQETTSMRVYIERKYNEAITKFNR